MLGKELGKQKSGKGGKNKGAVSCYYPDRRSGRGMRDGGEGGREMGEENTHNRDKRR